MEYGKPVLLIEKEGKSHYFILFHKGEKLDWFIHLWVKKKKFLKKVPSFGVGLEDGTSGWNYHLANKWQKLMDKYFDGGRIHYKHKKLSTRKIIVSIFL